MRLLHDPACAGYAAPGHPERPARVLRTAERLRERHPDWDWEIPPPLAADDAPLLRAHAPELLASLKNPPASGYFDADCAVHPDLDAHARRAAGAALRAAELALAGEKAFSLMRPPGHHATADRVMGFCYLNNVAIAALAARADHGLERVAVWDFDAHHGNGTESILHGREGFLFASVHQLPGWPGSGAKSFDNIRNFPVPPGTPPEQHLTLLRQSWADVLAFRPELLLVSAGFDAYADDPITDLTLRTGDFAELGRWLREAPCPVACLLEGGYSDDLPLLVDAFLSAWNQGKAECGVRKAD